jgi:SulP family sulfate permease
MSLNFNNYRRQWFTGRWHSPPGHSCRHRRRACPIPEAIGFSIIAGVDPRVGLYASVAIAITIALIGGRPGMISAATAAVAVLVVPLVRDHGVEYLFAATILMGVIQIVAGCCALTW